MMKYLKKVLLGVLLLVIRMQSSFPMGAGAGSSVRRQAAYACNFCDAVFSKMTEFVSHRLQKHAQSVGFACDFCGEKCMSPIALREHKKMHSDKPLFSCEICNKAFYKKNELAVHKKKHAAVSAEPFSESTMPVMAYTEAVDTGEKDDSPVAEVVSVPSISSVEATQVLLSPLTPAKEAIPDEVHVASETQDFEQYDGGYDDYTNADVTEENIISELKASDVTVESACAASGADLPEEGSIYRDIEIERGLPPATELSVAQTDGAALASVANPVAKVEKIRRGPVRKETSGFCTYCNKNFKALVNHQRVKHLGLFSNHACDHCSMIFANGDYLERHLLNSHGIGTSGRSNRKKARIDDGIAVLGQIVDALEGLLALDGLSDL